MKFSLFHGQLSLKQAIMWKSSHRIRIGGTLEVHLCFAKFTFTVQSDLEKLRADYGGRKNNGVKKNHAVKGGGSNIRKILQQLETAGLIQTTKPKGRVMSPKGRKLLQEVAGDLNKEIVKTIPELKKYQGE